MRLTPTLTPTPTHSDQLIKALDTLQENLADGLSDVIASDHTFDVINLSYLLLREFKAKCPSVLEACFIDAVSIQRAAQAYADKLANKLEGK